MRQWSQVIDGADDIVASLFGVLDVQPGMWLGCDLGVLLGGGVGLLEGGGAAVCPGVSDREALGHLGGRLAGAAGGRGSGCGRGRRRRYRRGVVLRGGARWVLAAVCGWVRAERRVRGVFSRMRDRRALAAGRRRIEERVGQVSHAQRHLQRPRRVGLEHAVEERLQVRLGVLFHVEHQVALVDLLDVLVHRHLVFAHSRQSLVADTMRYLLRVSVRHSH